MLSEFRKWSLLGVLLALTTGTLPGQNTATTPPKTAVNPDGSITFRLTYPGGKEVSVRTDATLQPLPMTVDANGVWSATTPSLQPNYYAYTFVVDGVHMSDPLNHSQLPNYVEFFSEILVPAATPAPWELTAVPHGAVTHYIFTTRFGQHYPSDQTGYVVYTPPGYDPKRKPGYPVLYLLHGYSSGESEWTGYGKANMMLDSLLAGGKIVPMIVVMPRGYGDFDLVGRGISPPSKGIGAGFNSQQFFQTLTEEIIPAVEREYNVASGRENRAIAGVSMGGVQSMTMGLTHPELFAWIGGMSSAVPRGDYDTHFPGVDAKKANLRLLWIACGKDDFLYANNQAFIIWAKEKGLPVTAVETPGWHANFVWRNNLLTLAPLLFRK